MVAKPSSTGAPGLPVATLRLVVRCVCTDSSYTATVKTQSTEKHHDPSNRPHTLLSTQSCLINASGGFHLKVQSGCLWLTRPSDSVDRFLVAGSSIELHENHVLVQSDSPCSTGDAQTAHYWLTPLNAPHPVAPENRVRQDRFAGVLTTIFGTVRFGTKPKLRASSP